MVFQTIRSSKSSQFSKFLTFFRLYGSIMQQMYSYFINIVTQAEALENRITNMLRQQDLNPDLEMNEQEEKITFRARFGIRDEIDKIERSV